LTTNKEKNTNNTRQLIMIDLVEQPHTCVHCGKSFMKDRTHVAHMCERKRRALQRDEKRVQAGFMAFNRFWELTQNSKKQKTYDEFADSNYYNAFVKFGSFVNNSNVLYPDKFIDYVIKSGIKLDHWCREEIYYQYVIDTIRLEPAGDALSRSIETMVDWAGKHSADFAHYFKYCNPNLNLYHLREGLVSPWLQLNTPAGRKLLQQFDDHQLGLIDQIIDPLYWKQRFKARPNDIDLVKETITEARIL